MRSLPLDGIGSVKLRGKRTKLLACGCCVMQNFKHRERWKEAGDEIMMTEREMFERTFDRPRDFFELSPRRQWEIDDNLGILDWYGDDLTEDDKARFDAHYKGPK